MKRLWWSVPVIVVFAAFGLRGSSIATAAYNLIESAGSALTQRSTLNFVSGVTCVDNAGANRTDCTGGSGSGNPAAAHTVSFSATPTFTATSNTIDDFTITLTGNVTGSTLAGASTGQIITMKICQDATGSRTFTWPTNFVGNPTISPTASSCTRQSYYYDGTNAQAVGPAVTDSGPGYVGTQAAPSGNPASGFLYSWCDSTDNDCEVKNASGSVFAMFLKGGDANPVTGVVTGINGGTVICATTGGIYYQNGTAGRLTCDSGFTVASDVISSQGLIVSTAASSIVQNIANTGSTSNALYRLKNANGDTADFRLNGTGSSNPGMMQYALSTTNGMQWVANGTVKLEIAPTTGNLLVNTSTDCSNAVCASGSVSLSGSLLLTSGAAATVGAGQVSFGATTALVANCGVTGPTACLVINVAGTTRYIPYY